MKNTKFEYYGISDDYTVRERRYEVRLSQRGNQAKVVVYQGMSCVYKDVFGSVEDAENAIDDIKKNPIYCDDHTPILEWFMDGGKKYESRYPGKDITGKKFEKGTMIWRKRKRNLVA